MKRAVAFLGLCLFSLLFFASCNINFGVSTCTGYYCDYYYDGINDGYCSYYPHRCYYYDPYYPYPYGVSFGNGSTEIKYTLATDKDELMDYRVANLSESFGLSPKAAASLLYLRDEVKALELETNEEMAFLSSKLKETAGISAYDMVSAWADPKLQDRVIRIVAKKLGTSEESLRKFSASWMQELLYDYRHQN